MAWWYAVPIVIWGAKKIYDAVTKDDEPSHEPSSRSKLSSAKSARTRLRKKLIREAILENRKLLISKTFSDTESKLIKPDDSSKDNVVLDVSGFNSALADLSNTVKLLNPNFNESFEEVENSLLVFKDLKSKVDGVAKKANDEYGSMAGINHHNEYDSSTDPFVAKLQSCIQRNIELSSKLGINDQSKSDSSTAPFEIANRISRNS